MSDQNYIIELTEEQNSKLENLPGHKTITITDAFNGQLLGKNYPSKIIFINRKITLDENQELKLYKVYSPLTQFLTPINENILKNSNIHFLNENNLKSWLSDLNSNDSQILLEGILGRLHEQKTILINDNELDRICLDHFCGEDVINQTFYLRNSPNTYLELLRKKEKIDSFIIENLIDEGILYLFSKKIEKNEILNQLSLSAEKRIEIALDDFYTFEFQDILMVNAKKLLKNFLVKIKTEKKLQSIINEVSSRHLEVFNQSIEKTIVILIMAQNLIELDADDLEAIIKVSLFSSYEKISTTQFIRQDHFFNDKFFDILNNKNNSEAQKISSELTKIGNEIVSYLKTSSDQDIGLKLFTQKISQETSYSLSMKEAFKKSLVDL